MTLSIKIMCLPVSVFHAVLGARKVVWGVLSQWFGDFLSGLGCIGLVSGTESFMILSV